jgi:hypothetical protein
MTGLDDWLGTSIGGSVTLRAAGLDAELPEPPPARAVVAPLVQHFPPRPE